MTAISATTHDGTGHRTSSTMRDGTNDTSTRGTWLRGWRFQIMVLTLIALAGVLTYLARTVLYFPVDVEVAREVQSVQNPSVVRFFDAVAWVGFPPQSNYIFG